MATNFNISSRQGFKSYGLLGAFRGLLMTIPCQSLPDPCLSFTILNSTIQRIVLVRYLQFLSEETLRNSLKATSLSSSV